MTEGESGGGYTLREAGDRLGLSPRQVRRYVTDGRLPASLRPGPHGTEYVIPESALDALAASRAAREANQRVGRVRPAPSAALDPIRPLSAALADHLAALERAWERIAALEAENARLHALLEAPRAASDGSPVATPESAPVEAPGRPPASRAAATRRGLRERWRRLRGG